MGKLITYLSILIFIDLLLLITGQFCVGGDCTLSSILFNAILNIGDSTKTTFFSELIGNLDNKTGSLVGILSLFIGAGAVLIGGFLATKDLRLLLIPMMLTMALLASDFVTIAARLISLNPILGTMIMAPITIMYYVVVVEWWRGKD